jgi:ribosomal protein L11 methyltransferase
MVWQKTRWRDGEGVPMQWLEMKIALDGTPPDWVVDLLANIFTTYGLKGVVIDDPVQDPLGDWASDAVPLPDKPAVTGYLPMDHRLDQQRLAIERDVADLAERHVFQYTVRTQTLDEEDWAEAWKAFFHPQKVSSRLVVKPTWRSYAAAPGEQVIEIDPGMAFGTGTHPTTALCLQLLEKHLIPGQRILDVGTGSGILLIAAAKLGASRLTGVDSDPMAVAVARKNLRLNGIDLHNTTLCCGNLVDCIGRSHHMVVANILAHVIVALLDHVPALLTPGGIFICSGIIKPHQDRVTDKLAACGLDLVQVLVQEDWVAMVARKQRADDGFPNRP